jgi:hypothetical protein
MRQKKDSKRMILLGIVLLCSFSTTEPGLPYQSRFHAVAGMPVKNPSSGRCASSPFRGVSPSGAAQRKAVTAYFLTSEFERAKDSGAE